MQYYADRGSDQRHKEEFLEALKAVNDAIQEGVTPPAITVRYEFPYDALLKAHRRIISVCLDDVNDLRSPPVEDPAIPGNKSIVGHSGIEVQRGTDI